MEKHDKSIDDTRLDYSSMHINLDGAVPVKGKINFKELQNTPVILEAKIICLK